MLLDALSKDFLLEYSYIEELCRHHPAVRDILLRLMPCVVGGPWSWKMCQNYEL